MAVLQVLFLLSIIFRFDLKEALGMGANGADIRCLLADNDVSAVAALPDSVALA